MKEVPSVLPGCVSPQRGMSGIGSAEERPVSPQIAPGGPLQRLTSPSLDSARPSLKPHSAVGKVPGSAEALKPAGAAGLDLDLDLRPGPVCRTPLLGLSPGAGG